MKTQVLVENGGTVVIGGIFQQSENQTEQKIPLLGDIPVMGNLFKNNIRSSKRSELLIFLTPKVVSERLPCVDGKPITFAICCSFSRTARRGEIHRRASMLSKRLGAFCRLDSPCWKSAWVCPFALTSSSLGRPLFGIMKRRVIDELSAHQGGLIVLATGAGRCCARRIGSI